MKKEVQTTKSGYPLMRYLSLLLVVALLFSGVTFARYALERSGSVDTGVALFDASYTVEGVNSLTFGNQSYWMNYSGQWYEQGEGSARTVRIGMQNKSDVNVRANVLHMEGPAEFWENIALQLVATADNSVAAGDPLTTQYVLADFLRERQGGTSEGGETHGYTYGAYRQWGESGTFDTVFSDEFGQRDSIEETFSMSGGIDFEDENGDYGSVTAVRQSARDTADSSETPAFSGQDLTITITASMQPVNYSVGFARSQNERSLPVFYLDCKKEVPYYSIDITLPETNYFNMAAGNGTTSVIAFLTWTDAVPSSDLSTRVYQSTAKDNYSTTLTWEGLKTAQDASLTYNGATVTGYHFNYTDVPAQQGNNKIETTVRMNKDLGNNEITLQHVASLSEEDVDVPDGVYAHDILNGDVPLVWSEDLSGTYCCRGQTSASQKNKVSFLGRDLVKCDGTFDPDHFILVTDDDNNTNDYSTATEKGYPISFSVFFVQNSELPESIETP